MHEITTIDYWSFGIRGVEIYGAFVIAAICFIAITVKVVTGQAKWLACGIASTMIGFGINRSFWFNARWHLEHGDAATYNYWMAVSQYPSGLAALLFFIGCALHFKTLIPNQWLFAMFIFGAGIVASAVVYFI